MLPSSRSQSAATTALTGGTCELFRVKFLREIPHWWILGRWLPPSCEVVSVYRVCIRCLNTTRAEELPEVLELPCRLFRAAAHHTGALLRRLNMSRPDARRSVAGARRVLGHHLVPPLARLDGAEEPSLTSVCESTARAAAR